MATDEPRWDLFGSDLNVSKMAIKRHRPSLLFEIPILPQAGRYKPGMGPPPPRVDLQLVHDTNAFILHKLVLPLGPFAEPGDPRQRRVYYIIGWPDIPAARPVIDATRILDYVSPRALEGWEYQDALRREAEEEQAAREAAAAAAGAVLLPNGKKPGRKPKNAKLMLTRAPTPQLDSEQEEQLARRKHGPSLSTPQKSRIAQLDAEMKMEMLDNMEDSMDNDQDDEEEEMQLQLQLENEVLGIYEDSVMHAAVESDALDTHRESAAASGFETSRASSLLPAPPALESGPLSRASPFAEASRSESAHDSPAPSFVKQKKPLVVAASSRLSQTQPRRPVSTTPIPLPPWITLGPKIQSSSPSRAPTTQPVPSTAKSRVDFAQEPSSPVEVPPTLTSNGGFTPTNNFTPVGGYFPRPPKRPADDSPPKGEGTRSTPTSTKSKKGRKNKTPKTSQPPLKPTADSVDEAPAQQEWVVKRLEGHDIIDGEHYFKVRWEGDWPPDQNPTWEPQDNISANLVKKYLKREAKKARKTPARGGATGSSSKSQPNEQLTLTRWVTGYSSVSEAFEGKAELDATTHQQGNSGLQDYGGAAEDDEDRDELLVVDESKAKEHEKAADDRRKALGAQVAAQFASMAPGRASGY